MKQRLAESEKHVSDLLASTAAREQRKGGVSAELADVNAAVRTVTDEIATFDREHASGASPQLERDEAALAATTDQISALQVRYTNSCPSLQTLLQISASICMWQQTGGLRYLTFSSTRCTTMCFGIHAALHNV
jgi:hypothetical protein